MWCKLSKRLVSGERRIGIDKIAKSVPHPRLGQDVGGSRGIIFNLLAKSPDERSQVIEFCSVLRTPDGAQQLRMSHWNAPISHE